MARLDIIWGGVVLWEIGNEGPERSFEMDSGSGRGGEIGLYGMS